MTPIGVITNLYNMGIWHEAKGSSSRARRMLRGWETITLDYKWADLLESVVNDRWGHESVQPFEFTPTKLGGKRAVSYGLKRDYQPNVLEEFQKGGEIMMLAGVSRMWGQDKTIGIEGIKRVWWGRLTHWCKGHIGQSTHQVYRDQERGTPGRPQPHLPLDESETETD